MARGRPGAAADLPVRAGRGRRRRHGRRTGGDAEPGRARPRSPGRCPACGRTWWSRCCGRCPSSCGSTSCRRRTTPATSWPPCRRARSRCSTRWSGSCAAATGVVVPRDAWDWAKVPDHLRPTFRVVDEDGGVVAQGKDLEALKAPLRPKFAEAMAEAASDVRPRRHRRRPRGRSARSSGRSPRPAPGTRCAASPRWSTRARRSGCGCSAPRPSRTPRTAAACAGCWCSTLPVAGQGRRRRALQRRQARAGRVAVPLGDRAARGLRGRRGRTRSSTGTAVRSGTRRRSRRWRPPVRARAGGDHPARRARRGAGARRVARDRPAAQRVGGPAAAAGADRHEGPGRPAGAPRVRRRRRRRRSCATCRATSAPCAPGASGSAPPVGKRPAADGPGRAPPGGLPAPGRRAARRPPAQRRRWSRCAGCSRSSGSASGPSTSAPPAPSPTPGSARRSTRPVARLAPAARGRVRRTASGQVAG